MADSRTNAFVSDKAVSERFASFSCSHPQPPSYRSLSVSRAELNHVDDRHGIGGLINEIVEDVPHDGPGADVLCLEFANERKGVRMGLKSNRTIPDLGQPVGGPASPGLLSDVPSHLLQRFQCPRREDNLISTHSS